VPGDTASLSSGDAQPPPDLANPLAWGWVGAASYPGGSREAPNGRAFNPLSSLDLDFNLQLLPHKELYLFTNDSLWIRRSGLGASGLDRREADADLGLAWSFLQPFELRASAFSLTNLNRGAGGGLGPPSMNWRPGFWGVVGLPIYWAGTRMAPNGVAFTPIFDLSGDLNLGLLPDKELYLFGDGSFWGQHAAPGITMPGKGVLISARENWIRN
jgi:hypothetical protein